MSDPTTDRIDRILTEGPLGMAEAARLLGTYRAGRPCHPSTLTRWCLKGVRRPDGTAVRLEHIRVGDRLMTSKPAIVRLLAALSGGPDASERPVPRTPTQRRRAGERAAAELDAAGI